MRCSPAAQRPSQDAIRRTIAEVEQDAQGAVFGFRDCWMSLLSCSPKSDCSFFEGVWRI